MLIKLLGSQLLFMAFRINTYRNNYKNGLQIRLIIASNPWLVTSDLNELSNPNEKKLTSRGIQPDTII